MRSPSVMPRKASALAGRGAYPAVKPVMRPDTMTSHAYAEVRRQLMLGRMQPGAVYSANYFANLFGVSRTPVREALIQLTSEGFLVPVLGRGFMIREYSNREIEELMEARQIIEPHIVEHVVGRLTEQDFKRLDDSLANMRKAAREGAQAAFLENDISFHMTLVSAYKNSFLELIIEKVRSITLIFRHKSLTSDGRMAQVIAEHQDVLSALKAQDVLRAREAIKNHMKNTQSYLSM
jgi:DNA-binding GntR family transcriptional regulator